MSLAQWVHVTGMSVVKNEQTDINTLNSLQLQLRYWHKNRGLHDWMKQLYLKKGGLKADTENWNLRLTTEDINTLEKDYTEEKMKIQYNVQKEDFLSFLKDCRLALNDNMAILYSCWG